MMPHIKPRRMYMTVQTALINSAGISLDYLNAADNGQGLHLALR